MIIKNEKFKIPTIMKLEDHFVTIKAIGKMMHYDEDYDHQDDTQNYYIKVVSIGPIQKYENIFFQRDLSEFKSILTPKETKKLYPEYLI